MYIVQSIELNFFNSGSLYDHGPLCSHDGE